MGSEPVEELHVSLIYTAAAPHQHPWEAGGGGGGGGGWTDDVGKQEENSRERQLERQTERGLQLNREWQHKKRLS